MPCSLPLYPISNLMFSASFSYRVTHPKALSPWFIFKESQWPPVSGRHIMGHSAVNHIGRGHFDISSHLLWPLEFYIHWQEKEFHDNKCHQLTFILGIISQEIWVGRSILISSASGHLIEVPWSPHLQALALLSWRSQGVLQGTPTWSDVVSLQEGEWEVRGTARFSKYSSISFK